MVSTLERRVALRCHNRPAFGRRTRGGPAMQAGEVYRQEAAAMLDIAAFIRSRVAVLPSGSCVQRDLAHWAALLADAGVAALPERRVLVAVRSA